MWPRFPQRQMMAKCPTRLHCGTACLSYSDTDQICDLEVHNDHIWNDSSAQVVCALMRNCHHGCLICGHSVSCYAKRKLKRHRLSAQPVTHSLLWLVQAQTDGLVLDLFRPEVVCEVSLIYICQTPDHGWKHQSEHRTHNAVLVFRVGPRTAKMFRQLSDTSTGYVSLKSNVHLRLKMCTQRSDRCTCVS